MCVVVASNVHGLSAVEWWEVDQYIHTCFKNKEIIGNKKDTTCPSLYGLQEIYVGQDSVGEVPIVKPG